MSKRLSRGLLVVAGLASAVGLAACTHRGWDAEMVFVVTEEPTEKYDPVRLEPADPDLPEGILREFESELVFPDAFPEGVRIGDRLVCHVRQEYQLIAQAPEDASMTITGCRRA